jgi:hypothetical protein
MYKLWKFSFCAAFLYMIQIFSQNFSEEPCISFGDPARIQIRKCRDIFFTATFTYWNPTQDNMELGITSNTSDPSFYLNGQLITSDFQYNPGFKLGLGTNLDYDAWDIYAQYTWFRGDSNTSRSLSEDLVLLPSWAVPDASNASFFNGSQKWLLSLDIFDLELARHYYGGSSLSFRPFWGIRVAFIDQEVNVDYRDVTIPTFFRENTFIGQKSDSWAVGPRAGLHTHYLLGQGFEIYGNGSLDILYTKYTNLSFSQYSTNTLSEIVRGSSYSIKQKDDHHLRPHIDLEMGFAWGIYLDRNRIHFDLSAGYEFQVFFNQNMFRSFIDDQALGKTLSPNGNLDIHGLTLTARIDF